MTRSPAEIEREIESTRAHMTGTIEEIESRLTPGRLAQEARGYLTGSRRPHRRDAYGSSIERVAYENPVPVALAVLATVWLVSRMTGRRAGHDHRGAPRTGPISERGSPAPGPGMHR